MKNLPSLLRKIAGRRILVVGDIMLDHYLWGDVNRISPEAPVPVVEVARETDTVGGAGNVANNIAALEAFPEIVGPVGRDANGEKLLRHLRQNGIAFDDRLLLEKGRTITKTRVIVRNQQLCRLDHEDAPGVYREVLASSSRLKLIEEKVGGSHGIILSDYAKGTLHTAAISRIATMARKHGKFIALDPKPASGNQFQDIDLVTPNRREALELAGMHARSDETPDYSEVCRRIWVRFRPRILVITLGADGLLISTRGKVVKQIATAARQVFDVSGAGDTVVAALTLALVSGADIEEAAHFANAAAGVVVAKLGTATVTPAEMIAYTKN